MFIGEVQPGNPIRAYARWFPDDKSSKDAYDRLMKKLEGAEVNISVTRMFHYEVRKALQDEHLIVYIGLDIEASLVPEGDLVGIPAELLIILLQRHEDYVKREANK